MNAWLKAGIVSAFVLSAAQAENDVVWETVHPTPLKAGLQVPGRIIPQEGGLSIESARVTGRITSILRHEGENVAEGTPLFGINSAECISLLEEKHVAVSRGLTELIEGTQRREKQLGLSFDNAECQILATHSGTITKRQVELGQSFNVGDPLVTLLNVHTLDVELDVPERDLSTVKPGQRVRMELASQPGRSLQTTVQRILPTLDPVTRSSKVRLSPVSLPAGTTLDALVFAEISVENHRTIFEVPTTAVVFSHDERFIIKKTAAGPHAIAVDVVNENEGVAAILPRHLNDLQDRDQVAAKGAIYLLNTIANAPPIR